MTGAPPLPEAWLRGPIDNVPPQLQPVAHALLQALEDATRLTADIEPEDTWTAPGSAATAGFHLRHAAGSLDRLLTYARGEKLSAEQRTALAHEKEITPEVNAAELLLTLRDTIGRGIDQLRSTPEGSLDQTRVVGRAAYPSSVRGLLHHAAEHTARHIGQLSTTLKALR
jgi:hypothetical protein